MVNYNLKLKMEKTKSSRFEKDYTALKDFVSKLKEHMPNPNDFVKSKCKEKLAFISQLDKKISKIVQ